MKPISDGTEAEKKARLLFHNKGWDIQRPDFIAMKDERIILVEVKDKAERFLSPPFDGHGLDIKQIDKRLKYFFETNIDTYIIVFEKDKIFGQYLTELETGPKHDTKNGIRIYPLESYILDGGK